MSDVSDSLIRYLLEMAGQQAQTPEQQNLGGAIPQFDAEGDPVTLTSMLNQLQDVNSLIDDPLFQGMGGIGGFSQQSFQPTVGYEMVDAPEYQRWKNYLGTPDSFEGMIAAELAGGGTPFSALRKIQKRVQENPESELAQVLAMSFPTVDFDGLPTGEIDWKAASQGATQIDEMRSQIPQLGGQASYTMEDGTLVPGGEIMEIDGQLVRRTEEPSELMQLFNEAGIPNPYEEYTTEDFLPAGWSDQAYQEAMGNTDMARQAMMEATGLAQANLNPPPEAVRAQMEQRWGDREQQVDTDRGDENGGGVPSFTEASQTFDDWLSGRGGPAPAAWDWARSNPWAALANTPIADEMQSNIGNPLPAQAAGIDAAGGLWNWLQQENLFGRLGADRSIDAASGGSAPTGLNPSNNLVSDVTAGALGGIRDFFTPGVRGDFGPNLSRPEPQVSSERGNENGVGAIPASFNLGNGASDFWNTPSSEYVYEEDRGGPGGRPRVVKPAGKPEPSPEQPRGGRQLSQIVGAETPQPSRQLLDAMLAAVLPSGQGRARNSERGSPNLPRSETVDWYPERGGNLPRSESVDWYPQGTPGRMSTGEQLPASERVDWYGGAPEAQGESYEVTTGTQGTRQSQANQRKMTSRRKFREAWTAEQRAKEQSYGYDYGYALGMAAKARAQGFTPQQQVYAQRMQNILQAGVPLGNQPALAQYR